MDMVKRVAMALFADEYPDEQGTEVGALFWDRKERGYMIQARAVLASLVDPTDYMMDEGANSENTLEAMGSEYPDARQSCRNIWEAMINAALNENAGD